MRARMMAAALVMGTALIGASSSVGGAAPTVAAVGLALPTGQALYPGEDVPVTVVHHGSGSIYRSTCLVLARLTAHGWQQIIDTHRVNVACPIWAGEVQGPHSRQSLGLALYDDLRPGTYRITLYYRPAPAHWRTLKPLTHRDRVARLQFTIGRARRQPKPHLSEKRILRLAMRAAKGGGDPHPTLIQHAAGTHFNAVRIGQGDLVFEWNWSYLIAIRGHFSYSGIGPPGSTSTIHGTVITVVVDARTGQVTDSGLSHRYPPLAQLGTVTTDLHR